MSALLKIQSAGFQLSLKDSGGLGVIPASKLTQGQREFIKDHKNEIIRQLKAKNDSEPKYKRFVVIRGDTVNNVISTNGLTLSAMRNKFAKAKVEVLH